MFEAGTQLAGFLAYDLFIASLMKLLLAVNLVRPKTEPAGKQRTGSVDKRSSRGNSQMHKSKVFIDYSRKYRDIDEIGGQLMAQQKTDKQQFDSLQKKVFSGQPLTEIDVENIAYQSSKG